MESLKRLLSNDYFRHGLVGTPIALGLALIDWVYPASVVARTISLLLAVTFAWRYSKRPWRLTREGRHLMSFTLIVAAFMAYATANHVAAAIDAIPALPDGHYPGREVIGLVLYMLVAWELYQRNRLLTLATQRRENRLAGVYEGAPHDPID